MGCSQSWSCPTWSLGWRQTPSERCLSAQFPFRRGLHQQESSKLPGCPKGLCARGKTHEKGIPDPQQGKSCRWPGMSISYFGRGPCTSRMQKCSCHKTLCVPSAGWFSQGFYAFCDDSLLCGNLLSAGLSSLFISCGSHCTAVNHCKAGSSVSSHKFKCWKKRFVYSCASVLRMWLFIELCMPLDVGMMFGKSSGNLNSVRNLYINFYMGLEEVKWFGQDSTPGKVQKQERKRDAFGRALVQGWVYVCSTIWSRLCLGMVLEHWKQQSSSWC